MAITIDGTNGLTTDNAALKLDGTTLVVDDTNNRVGIGTASPDRSLHIAGTEPSVVLENSGQGTDLKTWRIYSNSSSLQIGTVDDAFASGQNAMEFTRDNTDNITSIQFKTGASNVIGRWTTDGLCFNGDTAAANALDDYEEGTWTPTVLGTSGNPTVGYTQQIGRYTKIGDRVFWQLSVLWNSFSGGSGTIAISLPFAVNSSAYNFPTAVVGYTGGITGTPDSGYTDPNQTGMFLKKNGTGGTTVTPADVGSSGSVFMSGHYQI